MQGNKGNSFSPALVEAMGNNLASGGQTLLFLNRRGFATYLVCQDCGHVFRCPNCAVSLTHHRRKARHYCHYCDYSIPAPSLCPECEGSEVVLLGRGTEKIEDEVSELLPTARVTRMDRDTTVGRGGHSRIIRQVEEGKVDILVGTQMVAKGHDFPGVTLVGVISVDASLNLPDFRSAERTFQILTQVSGRAGRGEQPGRVLVQTMSPDHYAIARAIANDCRGFCEEELAFRKELDYPPFSFLALLELSGNTEAVVDAAANKAASELSVQKRALHSRVSILGPASAPLGMLRGRHRRQILLKAKQRTDLHNLIKATKQALKLPATVRLTVDIDPVDML
jgi:primosomal protein N' (replication factor Y)